MVRILLDDRSLAALGVLKTVGATKKRFEASRQAANDRFVASRTAEVRQAARGVTDHPPTDEQAEAVATDEDVTLVLAGAGSGKTAVITAKVAHLVRSNRASPWRILVLAFNKKAVQEIRERLPADLEDVEVRTFHSFGRKVIADVEAAPTISTFATDKTRLHKAIDRWLRGMPEVLAEFIAYFSTEYRSPFDFETSQEYYDFVRGLELRTLSGDQVKSLEELKIANFLSANGVTFEYEANFRAPTATKRHRQYEPDFFLPDQDLYLEHFALDRAGNAPPHFRDYEAGVRWKRDIHRKHGTRLIETYSWQFQAGVWRNHLQSELLKAGVKLRTVPFEALVRQLRGTTISGIANLIETFLQHARGAGLSRSELRRRARASDAKLRNLAFLTLFEPIRDRYEAALEEENALDFNDLIIRAARMLEGGKWTSHYSHVLVDEFQDISAARMRLLKGLKAPETAFFLVGDDWQSIYRFAGSDVSLLRQCGDHLGHVRERPLSLTFRHGPGILGPTSAFVQRNPAQTRREVRSASNGADEGITVIPVEPRRQSDGIVQAIEDIELRSIRGGSGTVDGPSVLALGRYRRSRADVPEPRGSRNPPVDFSTVHGAKGLEADYGIVLDLSNRGFPSRKQDDPVLRMVLPAAKAALPHGEERRLFYVAATRAKRGTYLIVDRRNPSPFVRELLEADGGSSREAAPTAPLRQLGVFPHDGAPACPLCEGLLVPSQTEKNLRCTNHPHCTFLAPGCHACGEGFLVPKPGVAVCSSPGCGEESPLCPRCGRGVLCFRDGPYGRFPACSAYNSEPPCEYTGNA